MKLMTGIFLTFGRIMTFTISIEYLYIFSIVGFFCFFVFPYRKKLKQVHSCIFVYKNMLYDYISNTDLIAEYEDNICNPYLIAFRLLYVDIKDLSGFCKSSYVLRDSFFMMYKIQELLKGKSNESDFEVY